MRYSTQKPLKKTSTLNKLFGERSFISICLTFQKIFSPFLSDFRFRSSLTNASRLGSIREKMIKAYLKSHFQKRLVLRGSEQFISTI